MDLIIPLHPKDIAVLPHTIAGARKNLFPEVTRVLVITDPLATDARALIDRCGAKYIDENKVIPGLTRTAMPPIRFGAIDRTGWYFQQLLKFYAHLLVTDQYYTVVDADLVFVDHTEVVRENKYVFQRDSQHHTPYFETYEALFGYPAVPQLSFIADHMVFDTSFMAAMLAEIAAKHFMDAPHAILSHCHGRDISTFADYETYGQWVHKHHPDSYESVQFRNLWLPVEMALLHSEKMAAHAREEGYTSIAYHNRPNFNHLVPNRFKKSTLNVVPGVV